jgi:hypothetical protein
MQSNENNEFSDARCVAGWVRVANAAPKPPIVSGGYNSRTCRRATPIRRIQFLLIASGGRNGALVMKLATY